jgi:hypothetical protein
LFYAIYVIFKDAAAAFVAACLLGTNSWFLLAVGWNYVDGPLIACTFVSLAALVEAARGKHWRTAAVIWGAITAAMLAIYLMNAILLPTEVLIFIALGRLVNRRRTKFIALLWISGFAGAVLTMGLANWSVGGPFNFITPTLAVLSALTPSATKGVYYVPWHTWLPTAPWLLLPGFVVFASSAFAIARGRYIFAHFRQRETGLELDNETDLLILTLALIVTASGFGFMQALHWGMLSFFFRANALWPFVFLTLGGFISIGLSRGSRRSEWRLATAAAILCFAPWLLGALGAIHAPLPFFPTVHAAHLSTLRTPVLFYGVVPEMLWTLGGAAFLFCTVVIPHRLFLLLPVAFASLLSVATISVETEIRLPQDTSYRDRTLAAFDAASIIDKTALDRPILWWDTTEPDQDIFLSLGSMYLQPNPAPIGPGDRVVFLGSNGDPPQIVRSLLADERLTLKAPIRWLVRRGSVAFDIAIDQIDLDPHFFEHLDISLSDMEPRSISSNGDVNVVTPAEPWAYGATLQIPQEIRLRHPAKAFVQVQLQVTKGSMGIGMTSKDGTSWIDRKFFRSSPMIRDVYLTIPAVTDVGELVFCTDGTNLSSVAAVHAVRLLYARK